ncbi:hypothetical protein KIN20_001040 [Parelaphostrongylus tenuis]|uniref:Small ribosomal subunit protein eS21 n=1 Tax=Parelaphostrongylus tenuis TaxID=148309 RepID=A0AAD5QG02_PARTN|nr:hypothetical protein KIN20_001040 [Parelaphostrongylus tenuis]
MQNDAGETVELYVPRKCSSSNRLIGPKDHSSIQIDIVDVDPITGRMVAGKSTRYAICGALRRQGESDDALLRLFCKTAPEINLSDSPKFSPQNLKVEYSTAKEKAPAIRKSNARQHKGQCVAKDSPTIFGHPSDHTNTIQGSNSKTT